MFSALVLGTIYLSYLVQYLPVFTIFFAVSLILGGGYIAVVKGTSLAYTMSNTPIDTMMYRLLVLVGFVILFFLIPQMFGSFYELVSGSEQCIHSEKPINFQYFSYTTFTTLGYGDQSPIGFCRHVAVSEAMLGLTVMPIMIALTLHVLKGPFNP